MTGDCHSCSLGLSALLSIIHRRCLRISYQGHSLHLACHVVEVMFESGQAPLSQNILSNISDNDHRPEV